MTWPRTAHTALWGTLGTLGILICGTAFAEEASLHVVSQRHMGTIVRIVADCGLSRRIPESERRRI